jgi:two-component system, LytTR family, response regulator
MISAIIVDDEQKGRESLKLLINEYCPKVEILTLCSNVSDAYNSIMKMSPDLVFLDIQMKDETGFDLLKKFDKVNFEVIITTAHSNYAITAIKYSAIDYLLKPIDVAELQDAVARVDEKRNTPDLLQRLGNLIENVKVSSVEEYKLAIPSSDGLMFIKATDIVYCEAEGNYTTFNLKNGKKYIVSKTLKEYENILNYHQFFRIHHSYLVNLKEIVKYTRGEGGFVTMSNAINLDVSKRKKESFLERISSV